MINLSDSFGKLFISHVFKAAAFGEILAQ